MAADKNQSYTEWLVLNSQQGDVRAFDELLRLWQQRWLLYGVSRLRDHELAREATQECLLAISRGIKRLQDPASFPKWSFQIMDRRCTDLLRRHIRDRNRRQALQQEIQPPPGNEDASRDLQLSLQEALQLLDEPLARLLRLYYLEGFALGEIAEIIGIPQGTVKSRLFHARKLMAKILEE